MPIPGFVLLLGGGYALLRTREPRVRGRAVRPARAVTAPPSNPAATPAAEPIPPTPKIS